MSEDRRRRTREARARRANAVPPRLAEATQDGLPGTRTLVRRTLQRLFGPPPFDPEADPGDPGLTGPGSASWQVIAEPAAIAGGIRGLLLQVAHPLAMAGVADHSRFREDPLGRLHRTSAYVTATTFGSCREALDITERVRRVHPHVRGRAPDGRRYTADDPRLLGWVSIALTASFLEAHRRWAPVPLPDDDEDRFVSEQSRIASLLDPRVQLEEFRDDATACRQLREGQMRLPLLAEGHLPTNVGELDALLDGFAGELGVNDQGRDALHFLRRPPIPLAARGGYRSLLWGAIGSLRPHEREALELDGSALFIDAAVRQASVTLALLRLTTGVAPSLAAATHRAGAAEDRVRQAVPDPAVSGASSRDAAQARTASKSR